MAQVPTCLEIINRALRLIGVAQTGESSSPDEVSDAFAQLNMMLGQWANQRLMMYGHKNELFPLIAGKGVYTIGDGCDFDTSVPQKIERAFVRYTPAGTDPTMSYDYQLEIIPNDKYQEIFLKQLTVTYPIYLYYNKGFPASTITLFPYPSQNCTLGISTWNVLRKFESYVEDITLPDGYAAALAWNLAIEMAPEYGKTIDPIIYDKAVETKADIMRTNTEISYMKTDTALLPRRTYNILTGSYQ